MYFCFILNHDYEQMEEKVAADTGEIGMSIGQESMCVMSNDGYVNVEIEMDDNISNQPGKKRKHDDVSEMNNESDNDAEVSTPQKKVCTSSSSTAPVEHDHTYCIGSPRRLRRKLDDVIDHAQRANKRLKKSRMKASRLKKKVDSRTSVVSALKKENLISSECATMLETTFSGVPKELMKRLVTQKKKKNPGAYPKELRTFAMTLKFYSAKAYKYVRQSFDLGLPHPSVISSWYNVMDGEPGFTKEALTALKAKVLAGRRDGQELVCSLMLDEMSIRKHVQWDGKAGKYRGFVDLGTKIDDDSLPEATEALVFMAVSVNSNWKVPCGYFLVNGLTGEEKANLTKDCLTKLHEVGVNVVSFTCDGPTTHQAMLKKLGVQLSAENMQAYFLHPCDKDKKIYVFLDACHMMKLVRNTMSEWKILKDKDGNTIEWKFIQELHELQEKEGLRLANKLRSLHVNWKPAKMKVNLAAQTLSSSVADALEYCEGKLHDMPQFNGCGPTVKFIRVFDRLFDVLNSRNPRANSFKAPIRKTNYEFVKKFLDNACEYIKGLKGPDGRPILQSKRKTGFLGFLLCVKAVHGLAKDLVCGENPVLKYLLTYKMSQDHLELFFGAVRASGGWNDNPTAMQFRSAYKQLMMRHNITGGRGNCVPQDDTEMLSNVEDQNSGQSSTIEIEDVTIARRYDLELRPKPVANDHDYCDVPNLMELSEFKSSAISYIAGYVVRMVERKIHCLKCLAALTTMKEKIPDLFVVWKSNGGLKLPSQGLLKICEETEKAIMRMLNVNQGGLPHCTGLPDAIASTVLQVCVEHDVFSSLKQHMFDTTAVNNHVFSLIKCCCKCYVTIRMHHLGKQKNAKMHEKLVRKEFSKLTQFKGQ